MILECEIRIDGQWTAVGVADAQKDFFAHAAKRCPACYGPLFVYTGGGAKDHFGHNQAHPGCPDTPHPKALT